MLTRFSIDMDGSMEPDEAGQWVRYEDVVKLREPAQPGHRPWRVAECLAVLRPTVKGKFPQEQALDELVGYLTSSKAQQPAPVQEPVANAWDEGYRAGINDERMSEANIGIAGFNAKIEPARNNPYIGNAPQHPAPVQEPFDFDAAFDAVNWDEWRHKPVRELVRELHRVTTPVRDPAPPADVPMLTEEEIKDAIRHLYQDETALQMSLDITLHEFRAIEQAVHQKAGLK